MKITQCRMARAGLGWSLDDLAAQSSISRRSVARFEAGEAVSPDTVEALRRALVDGGATFLDLEGRIGVAVRG